MYSLNIYLEYTFCELPFYLKWLKNTRKIEMLVNNQIIKVREFFKKNL